MDSVFIYWDNSNIFYGAQTVAEEKSGDFDARDRVRLDFDNLLRLAHMDRPMKRALAAGSIPPEMEHLWDRLRDEGVEVELYDRGSPERSEQEVPDRFLQLRMLEAYSDYLDDPGIVVLLTGDGAGDRERTGFFATLKRMCKQGWRVELLSWAQSTHSEMRQWVEEHGVFISLNDYYDAITFMNRSFYGQGLARHVVPLDLRNRRCLT